MNNIKRGASPSTGLVRREKSSARLSACEICILAGGLSTRMGRDKARLKINGRTLLAHVRAAARQSGVPVRVIRQDLVPRCGPLGGVYTALKTTRAASVVFLSCDMPFISAATIQRVIGGLTKRTPAVFFELKQVVGFPFGLKQDTLHAVENQLRRRAYSLQTLARTLKTKRLRLARGKLDELFNINHPADYALARRYPFHT